MKASIHLEAIGKIGTCLLMIQPIGDFNEYLKKEEIKSRRFILFR